MAETLREAPADLNEWHDWLRRLCAASGDLLRDLQQLSISIQDCPEEAIRWATRLERAARDTQEELTVLAPLDLVKKCQELAARADGFASAMDFRFLYNEQRHLFSTGYNLATGRLDNSHYDLLASEARLASFLAIARASRPETLVSARQTNDANGTRQRPPLVGRNDVRVPDAAALLAQLFGHDSG